MNRKNEQVYCLEYNICQINYKLTASGFKLSFSHNMLTNGVDSRRYLLSSLKVRRDCIFDHN